MEHSKSKDNMGSPGGTTTGGRRSRASRGKLRRNQEMDHVRVEDAFSLKEPALRGSGKAGEACYVTATVHNRRYYGMLVDQEALKTASKLYFQNEASSLDINRRMRTLKERQRFMNNVKNSMADNNTEKNNNNKRVAPDTISSSNDSASMDIDQDMANSTKRPCHGEAEEDEIKMPPATKVIATLHQRNDDPERKGRQVQKFRYVDRPAGSDFRVLLATYVDTNAAGEDDVEKEKKIVAACEAGGDFVGDYYYQFEPNESNLETDEKALASQSVTTRGLRMSLSFDGFLRNTSLPEWYPLSNLETGQQQVLETLGIKKDGSGALVWDDQKIESPLLITSAPSLGRQKALDLIPMEPRSRYRVVVVGGGIAGLSSCLELFHLCESDGVDLEVTLVEGRSRLGGRLWTDRQTFSSGSDAQGKCFVDLGASWIHGIDMNPLADLAREAGVEFIHSSEEVTMLKEGMVRVDAERDEKAGELFDKLLDMAVDGCWRDQDDIEENWRAQSAVRWYGEGFSPSSVCTDNNLSSSTAEIRAKPVPSAAHRCSSDTSVDEAIGIAIAKNRTENLATLGDEEKRMLYWNLKNVEYALGANLSDLSMQYWDIDECHAFEGAHVILKQGYGQVVDHLLQKVQQRGDRFTLKLNSPVSRIEYARKTTCNPYYCAGSRHRRFVELSDTCEVTTESGEKICCDFVVCAVPLGVLKDALSDEASESKLAFEPSLPFSKRDAIESVGFGLLDKVYVQFEVPFWRSDDVLEEDQVLFGNASKCNPHQYMFLDVGKTLFRRGDTAPAILMTLISGKEAVISECLSEDQLVAEVMKTLRTLFAGRSVPNPIKWKATRWGRDRFSRGSYTYLAPGTTDQDFRVLQSPINSNGDSLLLDGSETMRLFFAGEHTTALHPSMAHGAMLSGYRAAKEVIQSMMLSRSDDPSADRSIPLALFRHKHPKAKLQCALCHLGGSRVREGPLLAFKRGARELLVHNNCAEFSPEVEVTEGVWTDVVKACNRGKFVECVLCGQIGATVGCANSSCHRSYHFSCAEDTGWRFQEEGKSFSCDNHRPLITSCRKISVEYWLSKAEDKGSLVCDLCGSSTDRDLGELLAFQSGSKRYLVHDNCIRFTSLIQVAPEASSKFEKDYINVARAIELARPCERCSRPGATIECSHPSCQKTYHFRCACSLEWSAQNDFFCLLHRNSGQARKLSPGTDDSFQHTLFAQLEAAPMGNAKDGKLAEALGTDSAISFGGASGLVDNSKNFFRSEKLATPDDDDERSDLRFVSLSRASVKQSWGLTLLASIDEESGKRLLSVGSNESGASNNGLCPGDIVFAMNGEKVGSAGLDTIEKALKILSQEVEVLIEVKGDSF